MPDEITLDERDALISLLNTEIEASRLIAALISVVIIGAVTLVGTNLSGTFATIASKLSAAKPD